MIQSIKVKSWNKMGNNGLICALQGVMYPECMIMSCCKSGYITIFSLIFQHQEYYHETHKEVKPQLAATHLVDAHICSDVAKYLHELLTQRDEFDTIALLIRHLHIIVKDQTLYVLKWLIIYRVWLPT
ncbi:uncharacterized protein LOC112200476 [Rosa chinensis]|uniref:uncharacterized protein LOC112200476 n=1 Tax=Rosa chinensis TaxID=74649 RepID=UPI001AD90BF4|nr:uncharacterized protein LOC112200476 [Rosa chinensis]